MVILKVRTSNIPLGLHTEDFDLEDDDDGEEEEEDEEDHDNHYDHGEEEHGEEDEEEEEEVDYGVIEELTAVEVDAEDIEEEEEEEEMDMLDEVESVEENNNGHHDDPPNHSEDVDGDNHSSSDGRSDLDAGKLVFSDAVEGQVDASPLARDMSASSSLDRESQNVTAQHPSLSVPLVIAVGTNRAGSAYKETISTSFNSHTTNEYSISNSLGASWLANEVENLETSTRYISNGYPSNVSGSRVGKHNRKGVINDAVKDSDSDDDSSSCVSFLSMGSESLSFDRDFSKKHRSLSEEFVTTDRMSLSISNIEEEGDDDGEDGDDDDKDLKRIDIDG